MNKILNITTTDQNAKDDDASTRIKELERELQKHKVEEGRLKKVLEELDAAKARNAELEQQLNTRSIEEESSRIRGYAPTNTIADPDTLDAVAQMTARSIKENEKNLNERLNERLSRMESQMNTVAGTMSQKVISESIEGKYPGLINRLNSGDLSTSWKIFLNEFDPMMHQTYSQLASKAFSSNNENLMFYVIEKFLSNTGSQMQYGKESIAQPTSSATQETALDDKKRIYNTIAEVEAMLDKASRDYSAGKITQKEKNAVLAEFNSAISEGRILEMKQQ